MVFPINVILYRNRKASPETLGRVIFSRLHVTNLDIQLEEIHVTFQVYSQCRNERSCKTTNC
jgi:hypothetical protein